MYYQITANITITNEGWQRTIHCPTFYLNSNMQGIVSIKHAENIAYDMIKQLAPALASIHITVQKVEND